MPPAHTVWFYQSELPTVHERQQCGRAVFDVHHLTAERVRIGVTGDIDATNRQALGRFVERHTRASQQIVLDLKQSRLFGSQGFTPCTTSCPLRATRRGLDIVSNRAVDRILRICDCDTELPVVNDVGAAVDRLDRCMKYHHTASWAG